MFSLLKLLLINMTKFEFYHILNRYAIRESSSVVKIFKNFKEKKSFKPDFGAEGNRIVVTVLKADGTCDGIYRMYLHFCSAGIYGGFLLGVRSVNGLAFYDWENTELIRRIEIQPKHVRQLFCTILCLSAIYIFGLFIKGLLEAYCTVVFVNDLASFILLLCFIQIFWSDSGELVCIATEESFFILRYLADKVASSQENNEGVTEDGIEDAFEVSKRWNVLCWKTYFYCQC